jgi:hypothetical protein
MPAVQTSSMKKLFQQSKENSVSYLNFGMQVSASQKYGHDIISELRKVEVYEPLLIQPEGLVLTPGAHYVVSTCPCHMLDSSIFH